MQKDGPEAAQPAAYDAEGRPLYYQPPAEPAEVQRRSSLVASKPDAYEGHNFNPKLRAQYANEPDLVHTSRAVEPTVPELSEELRRRHQESAKQYPSLNLSEGEFVVLQIRRHPIGLLLPILVTVLAVVILTTFAFLVPDFYAAMDPTLSAPSLTPSEGLVMSVLLVLALLSVALGGSVVWVYQKNQFFMTNESVIQHIQHGLFSHHEQTVSLGSIEDASFRRQGILQHFFNYGTMRLSTEGEETTYQFAFVEDPKKQIAIVNNAVEAFKNGRPVEAD